MQNVGFAIKKSCRIVKEIGFEGENMIDIIYRCDFCRDVMTDQEYINQAILRKSPVTETDLHNYLVCEKCAAKINYALLRFKKENAMC